MSDPSPNTAPIIPDPVPPDVLPHPAKQRRWTLPAILLGLTLFTCGVACRDISVGGFSWSDAPLHAMDGVLLYDFVHARPNWPGREWSEQYYLRYPCLGIGVYYPPLFAAIEAGVFALMGISVFVARLTVVLFVIGSVWFIFLIGRELFGFAAGITAAVLTLVTPAGTAWSRQVMLEWPAVFWIALTLFAYLRYAKRPGWKWGAVMGLSCAATYLTKQTAAFALPVIIVHAVMTRQWNLMRRVSFALPLSAALAIIFAYAKATAGLNALAPQLLAGEPPWHHLLSADHWLWYAARLPAILGRPMLALLLAPLAAALCSPQLRSRIALPLLWAAAWWLISTVIAAKEERYFFFAVPAFALLAAAGIVELARYRPARPVFVVAAGLLAIATFTALTTPALRLADMKPTVAFLADCSDADLVLVDAVRDGQFVFDVRTDSQARDKLITLRASKVLYSRAARTRYDYAQHVAGPEDILAILDGLAVRYIVLEDRLPVGEDRSWDTPPRLMLRGLLTDTARFDQVFVQPLAGGDPAWDGVNLVTYRYKNAPQERTGTIKLTIPATGKTIEFDIR